MGVAVGVLMVAVWQVAAGLGLGFWAVLLVVAIVVLAVIFVLASS